MYKCRFCEFTCMSKKLLEQHEKRCELGISEEEEKTIILEELKKKHLEKLGVKRYGF